MGRHGKDLTPEVKKIILDLSNEGYDILILKSKSVSGTEIY
jgi:hypothetical protein